MTASVDIEGGAGAASLALFQESVADLYETLLVPILFERYASEMAIVAERSKPGSVLEVAAGTGALTRALRARLDPATEIVATDLSQAMIDVGASSLTMSRTHWMHADAQDLPFAPSMFDLVVCQFGVMFFPDKLKAYGEAKRVLRSGGRFLFSTWDSLEANDFARCVDEYHRSRRSCLRRGLTPSPAIGSNCRQSRPLRATWLRRSAKALRSGEKSNGGRRSICRKSSIRWPSAWNRATEPVLAAA